MAQEEKELLIRDICGRLPYGVKVQIDFGEYCIKYGIDRYIDDTVICVYPETFEIGVNNEDQACDIEDVKPYLRPMSSMTEEEREEIKEICADYLDEWENAETVVDRWKLDAKASYLRSKFYNSHHFDWNGLIDKGLALEAPKDMYSTKTKKI
jgi:hypothetical protein